MFKNAKYKSLGGNLYIKKKKNIYIYVVPSISFQTFFVQPFKIVVDSSKFTVIAVHLMR